MSIDTFDEANALTSQAMKVQMDAQQWESLCDKLQSRARRMEAADVFGDAAKRGAVYRWGIAASTEAACDETVQCLSRLACGSAARKRSWDPADCVNTILQLADSDARPNFLDAAHAVLAAAAMPGLSQYLDQSQWSQLLGALLQVRQSALEHGRCDAPLHLMLGGELGLTLAWRLRELPACKRLTRSSVEAVTAWCRQDDQSITAAISHATHTRLVLASLIRCQKIIEKTKRKTSGKQMRLMGETLATWVMAMTTHTGQTAFATAARKAFVDDLSPRGLLDCATEFAPQSLKPAMDAALGATQTGGRLAWQVALPEALHHDPHAKLAIMIPDWDVRRGRTHIDYSGEEVRIEVSAGRPQVIAGRWQTIVELDDDPQHALGPWEEVCEFTDDDVHYLEIEQPWTGGLLLQRQIMLVRDDRCLLLADAVLPSNPSVQPGQRIQYLSRLPLTSKVGVEPLRETREMFLSDDGRRSLVIPLSAGEWQVGPSDATLKHTEDHHLILSTQGRGCLYAPLWFDFQQRRFKRKRTWRQLTVGDQLRIVGRNEAVGYRVQVGSEQWMLYRSLAGQKCRTVLGKHILAGFFCSRFDPSDGNHEELVTVDDSDGADE